MPLLELCLEKGADVLARDGRGKLPMDAAKDAETRSWLKQGQFLKRWSGYHLLISDLGIHSYGQRRSRFES